MTSDLITTVILEPMPTGAHSAVWRAITVAHLLQFHVTVIPHHIPGTSMSSPQAMLTRNNHLWRAWQCHSLQHAHCNCA